MALTRARFGVILLGNARILAKNPLWHSLITHYKENSVVVEGPLTMLQPTMMTFPAPRIRPTDRQLYVSQLSTLSAGNPVLPPWVAPMQGYFTAPGRRGGDGGKGGPGGWARNGARYPPMDSRFDPRYEAAQAAASVAGGVTVGTAGVGGRTTGAPAPTYGGFQNGGHGFGYEGSSQGSARSYPQSQAPFTQQGSYSGHFNMGMGSQPMGFSQGSERLSYGAGGLSQDSSYGGYDDGYAKGGRSGGYMGAGMNSQGPMSQVSMSQQSMSQDSGPSGRGGL